jgi:hypothetical protein
MIIAILFGASVSRRHGTSFLVLLGGAWTKCYEDFGTERRNFVGVREVNPVGIVGGADDRQIKDRVAEIGDRDQVSLVSGVNFLLGDRIVVKFAAGEDPIDRQRSFGFFVPDPLASV